MRTSIVSRSTFLAGIFRGFAKPSHVATVARPDLPFRNVLRPPVAGTILQPGWAPTPAPKPIAKAPASRRPLPDRIQVQRVTVEPDMQRPLVCGGTRRDHRVLHQDRNPKQPYLFKFETFEFGVKDADGEYVWKDGNIQTAPRTVVIPYYPAGFVGRTHAPYKRTLHDLRKEVLHG